MTISPPTTRSAAGSSPTSARLCTLTTPREWVLRPTPPRWSRPALPRPRCRGPARSRHLRHPGCPARSYCNRGDDRRASGRAVRRRELSARPGSHPGSRRAATRAVRQPTRERRRGRLSPSCFARSSSRGRRCAVERNGSASVGPGPSGSAATMIPPTSATTCCPFGSGGLPAERGDRAPRRPGCGGAVASRILPGGRRPAVRRAGGARFSRSQRASPRCLATSSP